MPRLTKAAKKLATAKKQARRKVIAKGRAGCLPNKTIAKATGTSVRTVQRTAAEPETQVIITKMYARYEKRLQELAGKVIDVIGKSLGAMKKDKQDHFIRLRAVERFSDVLEAAQGAKPEPVTGDGTPEFTWEEFTSAYQKRKVTIGKNNPVATGAKGN